MSTGATSLSMRDVRCFAGEQRAELSRITLLVGENSAGKSTFLGCLSGLARLAGLRNLTDDMNCFDQKPFSLGSFESIVRSGCPSFRVGIGLNYERFRRLEIEFVAAPSAGLQEMILELELTDTQPDAGACVIITRQDSEGSAERWCFSGPDFKFVLNQSELSYKQFTTWLSRSIRHGVTPFDGQVMEFKKRTGSVSDQEVAGFSKFTNFFRHRFRAPEKDFPIKSPDPEGFKRERSYSRDPLADGHENQNLSIIGDTGFKLGLFDRVKVREHGPGQHEVLIGVSGAMRNLVDVGYGVASVLPLVKDLAEAPVGTLFLLQQPEVHIHPSAQAKLAELMADSDHQFVVETHSDHVIDWVRILVTEGKLAASEVSILYFERFGEDQSKTQLHQLSLDGSGNLCGQPRNYRQFFSEETARLLGLPT